MHLRGQHLPHTASAWGLCCTAGSEDYYSQEHRAYSGETFYPGPYDYQRDNGYQRSYGYQSSHNHTASYAPRSYYGHDRSVDMWDVLTRRNKSNCAYSRHGYDCHGYSEFLFRLHVPGWSTHSGAPAINNPLIRQQTVLTLAVGAGAS